MLDGLAAILVVDDNPDHAEMLAELLSDVGYEVVTALSAEQGLVALRARRFAVVVTDQQMPGKTGSMMLAEAKADGLLDNTRALVFTCAPHEVVGWRAFSKVDGVNALLSELESLRDD